MNRKIENLFVTLEDSIHRYETVCNDALLRYRTAAEHAEKDPELKKFVDPKAALAERCAVFASEARPKIRDAKKSLRADLKRIIPELKDALLEDLRILPSDQFIKALTLFRETDMTPSRLEAETLLSLCGKSALGYNALNHFLEASGSLLRVQAASSEKLSDDLMQLERFADSDLMYAPVDLYSESIAVWREQPIENDWLNRSWEPLGIIAGAGLFNGFAKEIPMMQARWTETVVPEPGQVKLYEATAEESAAKKYMEDLDAAKPAEIASDPVATGKQIAVEAAKGR